MLLCIPSCHLVCLSVDGEWTRWGSWSHCTKCYYVSPHVTWCVFQWTESGLAGVHGPTAASATMYPLMSLGMSFSGRRVDSLGFMVPLHQVLLCIPSCHLVCLSVDGEWTRWGSWSVTWCVFQWMESGLAGVHGPTAPSATMYHLMSLGMSFSGRRVDSLGFMVCHLVCLSVDGEWTRWGSWSHCTKCYYVSPHVTWCVFQWTESGLAGVHGPTAPSATMYHLMSLGVSFSGRRVDSLGFMVPLHQVLLCITSCHLVCLSVDGEWTRWGSWSVTWCVFQLTESGLAGVHGPTAPSHVMVVIRRGCGHVDTPSTGAASVRATSHSSGSVTCDPAKVCSSFTYHSYDQLHVLWQRPGLWSHFEESTFGGWYVQKTDIDDVFGCLLWFATFACSTICQTPLLQVRRQVSVVHCCLRRSSPFTWDWKSPPFCFQVVTIQTFVNLSSVTIWSVYCAILRDFSIQ